MQHVRAAGDAQCTPFASLCRSLVGWPDGLDCGIDRHACSKRDDVWPRLPLVDKERTLAPVFALMRRRILSMSSSFCDGIGTILFDHLVGEREQPVRNLEAKRLGGLEIDD